MKNNNLDEIDEELADKWAGEQHESSSIRALTEEFNQKILRSEMAAAEIELVEGRVENFYRLLIDDGVLDAMELQARTLLEEDGINVDALMETFVSHQTLYRHFRNCLEVRKETQSVAVDTERSRLNRLQSRSEAVIDDSISRLQQADEITLEKFEILVNFRISCEVCGTLYDAADLLDKRGCDCQNST